MLTQTIKETEPVFEGGTFMKLRHSNVPDSCRPVTDILSRIGDKWSVGVIRNLGIRKMRFTELRKALEGISQKMLTTTLRALERDGHITRTVFPTVPPRVEYELTDLGRDLSIPIAALGQWAQKNRSRIEAARAAFDRRVSRSAVD
jgi:DNA-binding HxlR family transcriptional regulator